jgi:hypothetical protein
MVGKVMKILKKHKLDFASSYEFFKDNLSKTNALSNELLKEIDFKKGYFFTLLPDDANLETLYNFRIGIMPEKPPQEYFINGERAIYSEITTIREETAEIILKYIHENKHMECIFDNVNGSFKEIPLKDSLEHFCMENKFTLKKELVNSYNLMSCCRQVFLHSLLLQSFFDNRLAICFVAHEGIKFLGFGTGK